MHAILLYSQSAEELLKRKKVFREIIFKYLATKGVIVPPSSEKHQLIEHAKRYWCTELKESIPELKYTEPDTTVLFIACISSKSIPFGQLIMLICSFQYTAI